MHDWRCDNCGKDIRKLPSVRGSGWLDNGKRYCCNKCRDEAEAREAAKKEAKEAKKAAKQAAREEEYESGGGSSSSAELPSGCVKIVGMILAFLVVCGILGMLFCKNEDANDPAVKMAKWEEHLEKRRAAFAEGLPEEGVEARGLKNYTWEEWQTLQKKGQAKASEKPAEKVEDISEKYRAHMNKRMSLLNGGLTDKDLHEMGYDDYTFEAFKQNYKNIKYKTLEEIRQGTAAPTRPVAAPEKAAAPVDATAEAKAKKDAAKVAAVDAVGEQPNGTDRKKASADSKGIVITVQGKGKTKDAALRYAIRQAVWKTVGTWVGSKTRIEEKRDEVKALVDTVTEADVRKFEVLGEQQEGGAIVLKVKVYVSKKKIAPKFEKVFPDVFGNN